LSEGGFLESRRRRDRLDFSQVVKYGGGASFSRLTNPSFYLFGHLRKSEFDFLSLDKPSQQWEGMTMFLIVECFTRRGRFVWFLKAR